MLASFVGKIMAWHLAFPLARMYLSSFYEALSSRDGWDRCVKVRLPNYAMKLLKAFF